MSRMAANIAMARRNSVRQRPLPPPADHITRDESGRTCPVCLQFGRDECTEHRATQPTDKAGG